MKIYSEEEMIAREIKMLNLQIQEYDSQRGCMYFVYVIFVDKDFLYNKRERLRDLQRRYTHLN